MAKESKILSLSYDPEKLQQREAALRSHGFEVKSVYSPGQARFEIEMGTCGIFVTCAQIPDIVNRDLMDLFRRYCGANGVIIFVAADNSRSNSPYEPHGDVRIPQSQDPEGIVEALRNPAKASASSANSKYPMPLRCNVRLMISQRVSAISHTNTKRPRLVPWPLF